MKAVFACPISPWLLLRRRGGSLIAVELPERGLDLLKLGLGLLDRLLAVLQALLVVRLLFFPRAVLVRAKVLDLLAAVLDLGQPQGSGRALQEVAERRELREVFLLTV